MKTNRRFLLAAIFGFALTFTFSCSSDDDGGGGDEWYYDPNNENTRCRSGVVEAKCGDEWFNSQKYLCRGGEDENGNYNYYTITYEQGGMVRCGNGYYNTNYPDINRCQGGVLEHKCGDDWINPKYVCNNGQPTITWKQYYEQNGYVRCR